MQPRPEPTHPCLLFWLVTAIILAALINLAGLVIWFVHKYHLIHKLLVLLQRIEKA